MIWGEFFSHNSYLYFFLEYVLAYHLSIILNSRYKLNKSEYSQIPTSFCSFSAKYTLQTHFPGYSAVHQYSTFLLVVSLVLHALHHAAKLLLSRQFVQTDRQSDRQHGPSPHCRITHTTRCQVRLPACCFFQTLPVWLFLIPSHIIHCNLPLPLYIFQLHLALWLWRATAGGNDEMLLQGQQRSLVAVALAAHDSQLCLSVRSVRSTLDWLLMLVTRKCAICTHICKERIGKPWLCLQLVPTNLGLCPIICRYCLCLTFSRSINQFSAEQTNTLPNESSLSLAHTQSQSASQPHTLSLSCTVFLSRAWRKRISHHINCLAWERTSSWHNFVAN